MSAFLARVDLPHLEQMGDTRYCRVTRFIRLAAARALPGRAYSDAPFSVSRFATARGVTLRSGDSLRQFVVRKARKHFAQSSISVATFKPLT
jgi:hypothetical protein